MPVFLAPLVAQLVKIQPALRETWVWSLGWEDPLEKGTATHSSIVAWRIPWTLQSMGWQRVGHSWVTFTSLHFKLKKEVISEARLILNTTQSKKLWIISFNIRHSRFVIATLNTHTHIYIYMYTHIYIYIHIKYESHSSAIFACLSKVVCLTELEGLRHRKMFWKYLITSFKYLKCLKDKAVGESILL